MFKRSGPFFLFCFVYCSISATGANSVWRGMRPRASLTPRKSGASDVLQYSFTQIYEQRLKSTWTFWTRD